MIEYTWTTRLPATCPAWVEKFVKDGEVPRGKEITQEGGRTGGVLWTTLTLVAVEG